MIGISSKIIGLNVHGETFRSKFRRPIVREVIGFKRNPRVYRELEDFIISLVVSLCTKLHRDNRHR